MLSIQLLLFIFASGLIAYFSRFSLRDPRSHGFFRFFAWEAILAAFLRNLPVWFQHPFSLSQIISWFLLVASCFPVILGVRLLKRAGKMQAQEYALQRQDERLFDFEKTTRLVTSGIFRYIRHPMYSSLLLLAWGVFFKRPDWIGLILALAAGLLLAATAGIEEQENILCFGAAYQEYMRRTRRFIPFLFLFY